MNLRHDITDNLSLRNKLLLVSLGMIGVFIILLFQYTTTTYEALTERANQRLLSAAISTADSVEHFNQSNIELVDALSKHPAVSRYLTIHEDNRLYSLEYTQIQDIFDMFTLSHWKEFHSMSVGILDINGINLLDQDETRQMRDESSEDYFEMAILTGQSYVSPILFARNTSGGINLYYSAPIRDDRYGRIRGVVRIEYSLGSLYDILANNRGESGENSFAMLVDEPTHLFLAHDSNPDEYVFKSTTPWTESQFMTIQASQKVPDLSIDDVYLELPEFEAGLNNVSQSNPFFKANLCVEATCDARFAVVRLKSQPWFLIFGQPEDDFIAPVQASAISRFVVSATVVVILTAFIMIMMFRWITQPIGRLTQMAEQITAGDLAVRVDVTANDEVGVLATAFNSMASQLQNLIHSLEEQVEERTAKLERANEALAAEIAQHKQAQKDIVELQIEQERVAILSDFITNVSHEFKHPLSIINTNLYLVDRVHDPEKRNTYLEQIRRESDSILQLVDTLLIMSKLNSDYRFILERLDLNTQVRGVFRQMKPEFAEKRVLFKHSLAPDLPNIKGDAKLLHMVLKNILDNALRYTNTGGAVTIRTHLLDNKVVLIIRDSGMGIHQEQLPHVFKSFYRGDEARSTRGMGLGLSIVKRTIELHEATIDVQSIINEGTTFTIKFPPLPVEKPVAVQFS